MITKIIHILWKLVPRFIKRPIMDEFKLLARSVLEVPNQCILAAVRFVCWNQIPGDYLEFGCHSGRTFSYAYRLLEENRNRVMSKLTEEDKVIFKQSRPRFLAFDSFEGLPEAVERDEHPYFPRHWKTDKFVMSQQEFEEILASSGVNTDDVVIVKGWYSKTLVNETKKLNNLTRACIVHIDCDYYESTILALDFITDLVDSGTVIIFDDYNFFRGDPHLGERGAFSEWLSRNPQIMATELAKHDFDSVAFFLTLRR